jgi:hypothetical protein
LDSVGVLRSVVIIGCFLQLLAFHRRGELGKGKKMTSS